MSIFESLVKAAAAAPPTQTIQPAQPIQPLTPPPAGGTPGAPAPAGPGAFPAGPMSLNAGQQGGTDPAAVAAAEQQQQDAQLAATELKKTQDEVQELKAHEAEARAQVAKAQVETEKHKAQAEMLANANKTREQLAAEQAKHQAETAKLREEVVASKEKALQDHTKMIERAHKINTQPTMHSEYAKRIAKKVEALGSRAKIAFVLTKLAGTPASPLPPVSIPNVLPNSGGASPQTPAPPQTPTAPAAPATPPTPQLTPAQHAQQRQAVSRKNLEGSMEAWRQQNAFDESIPGKIHNVATNFINTDPDFYKNRFSSDGIIPRVMDSGLHVTQDLARHLWKGGEDFGKKDYAGAVSHGAQFVGSAAQPFALMTGAGAAPGAAGIGAKILQGVKTLGIQTGAQAGLWGAPAAADALHQLTTPTADPLNPDRYAAQYKVGDQYMSAEDELAANAKLPANSASGLASPEYHGTPTDAMRFQSAGYFQPEGTFAGGAYEPLSTFENPWIRTGVKALGPMFYPQVAPQAAAGGLQPRRYEDTMRMLAQLLQPGFQSAYPSAGAV